MRTLICKDYEDGEIIKYHYNELPDATTEAFSEHLEFCDTCWNRLKKIARDTGITTSIIPGESPRQTCATFELKDFILFYKNLLSNHSQRGILNHLTYCRFCPALKEKAKILLRIECRQWTDQELLHYSNDILDDTLTEILVQHLEYCGYCCGRLTSLKDDPGSQTVIINDPALTKIITAPPAHNLVPLASVRRSYLRYWQVAASILIFCISSILISGYFPRHQTPLMGPHVQAPELVRIKKLVERQLFDEAAKQLSTIPVQSDAVFNAQLFYIQGYLAANVGDTKTAIDRLTLSVMVADLMKMREFKAYVKLTLANTYSMQGDNGSALEASKEVIEEARVTGDIDRELRGLQIYAISKWQLDKDPGVKQDLLKSIELSDISGSFSYTIQADNFLALIKAEEGDYDSAEKIFRESFNRCYQVSDEINRKYFLCITQGFFAKYNFIKKDYTRAANSYKNALALSAQCGSDHPLILAQLHCSLADSLLSTGDPIGAESELEMGLEFRSEAAARHLQMNPFLSFAAANSSFYQN